MSETNLTADIEYRQIDRLPGFRFGSDGSVWSDWVKGSTIGSRRPEGPDRWRRLKPLLTPREGVIRYYQVSLTVAGKQKRFSIHQLIAEAFLGPCPPGMQVCHDDGNPLNIALSNLRYGTPQQNSDDVDRHGNRARGEKMPASKLRRTDIPAIREGVKRGKSYSRVANEHGVSIGTVYDIVKRKTWAWVP